MAVTKVQARAAGDTGTVQGAMNGGDWGIHQISTVLNEIVQNATGKPIPNVITTSDFVAVARTAINEIGWDKLQGQISQVTTRTIISARPYHRHLWSLYVDNIKWGNHVRKLQFVDQDWSDNQSWDLVDGQSVDMFKVKKDKVLQTNFYGQTTYRRFITWYQQQLDTSFNNPYDFMAYITGKTTELYNQIEQGHEELGRMLIANYIGAIVKEGNADRVIHLLTEFNAATGLAVDNKTVYQGDNFRNFMGWLSARLSSLSDQFMERTNRFQSEITGYTINRHTPKNKQKLITYSETMYQMQSMALSGIFHPDKVGIMAHETVGYWQSPVTGKRNSIAVKPVGIKPDGTPNVITEEVDVNNIFGVMFDAEAIGYTIVDRFSASTPFNTTGRYTNQEWHDTDRYWNDFTEKGVVLLLD